MKVIEKREEEPAWDEVHFYRTDFRPSIPGDWVNIWTTLPPAPDRETCANQMVQCTVEIARWLIANRSRFGESDRFQIVVGWPKSVRQTSRQVVKTGGDWKAVEKLASETRPVEFLRGWDAGVFAQ